MRPDTFIDTFIQPIVKIALGFWTSPSFERPDFRNLLYNDNVTLVMPNQLRLLSLKNPILEKQISCGTFVTRDFKHIDLENNKFISLEEM